MMRVSIFILYFLLIGCTSSKIIITPDKLPDAIVGELYYAEIEISGETSRVLSGRVKSLIIPNVLVVQSNPKTGWGNDNQLIIYGKPITTETITVKITGDMAPSFFNMDPKFEKTYVIKVKERE
ncbi:hypothetical protein [Entomomonas asaccharolytica]|uniref:Lipoprotein n=1 Tax=Entomomonas asaccharolytica TaxID=2785331 RepID=A0A974RW09_9GAMM|nr:hypothetical protein [Entomomonas asaccharolytica]QQP84665.1 hypothetical protein JHT90_09610 [Entomomonas asaccharolytica]